MEYLFKKFNMIDILGMLFPGGLLLLLLEQDLYHFKNLSYSLGIGADKLLWVVIFLCGSYFIGMLLHEIGSVVEKLMWKNRLLNPRVYAAMVTKMMDEYEVNGNNSQDKLMNKGKTNNIVQVFGIILPFSMVYLATGKFHIIKYTFVFVMLCAAALVTQREYLTNIRFYFFSTDKEKNKENWKKIEHIFSEEKKITTLSITTEENERKRNLFNGYYSLARSMLVLLAILQCYVFLVPDGIIKPLAELSKTINGNRAYLFLRVIIVTALVLRYWHYSCTKFIYIYNGYLENKNKSMDAF